MTICRTTLLMFLTACATHAQTTINRGALDSLASACRDSHSTSYAVWVEGTPVLRWNAGEKPEPIECHSVLKSISSLAVGRLITDGVLPNIDTPVYAYYPEWKQGYKKTITIRHLLNHTSGIESRPEMMSDWESAPDMVQVALCSDLESIPGESFAYNNKAATLLLGVIARASGTAAHKYIEENLLTPIGIENYTWQFDSVGNTTGLKTTSDELVKVGQLLLNRGRWNGAQLIAEEWIDLSLHPSQPFASNYGLLWYLIPKSTVYIVDDAFIHELRRAGLNETLIEKFELLKGTYRDVNIPEERLAAVFGKNWREYLDEEFYPHFPARSRREYSSEIIGYKAEGWLGQYIIVYPDKGIVAARMIANSDGYNAFTDEMMDFERYVYNVVE